MGSVVNEGRQRHWPKWRSPLTSPTYWDTDDDAETMVVNFLLFRPLSSSVIRIFNFFYCISLCIFLFLITFRLYPIPCAEDCNYFLQLL